MPSKHDLLRNLRHNTYTRLARSKTSGIGVIAVKDIPKDINPFILSNNDKCGDNQPSHNITPAEMGTLSPGVQAMVRDYVARSHNKSYEVPHMGLNSITVSWFMNHSNNPNVTVYSEPGCYYSLFKTLRSINKGEELFINYKNYNSKMPFEESNNWSLIYILILVVAFFILKKLIK